MSVPEQSGAWPPRSVLPDKIVFLKLTTWSEELKRPPPLPVPLLSLSAVLLAIVTLVSVTGPPKLSMPPPSPAAVLPLMVLLVIVVGPTMTRPPASVPAVLPLMVLPVSVKVVPNQSIPPASFCAELPLIVLPVIVSALGRAAAARIPPSSPPDVLSRTMLSVSVDDQHKSAGRLPNAGFDGGAVAFVVRVPDDAGAGRFRTFRRHVP